MARTWVLIAAGGSKIETEGVDKILAWNDDFSEKAESLSAIMHEKLMQIRNEQMRWAYETGLASPDNVGNARSLAEALTCGEKPSMWWTSILYERHPKISPNLFPLYKLRALEMIMETGKPDNFLLIGGDSVLKHILQELTGQMGIKFTAKGDSQKHSESLVRKIYRIAPAPCRAIARFAHWLLTVRRHLPFVKKLPPLQESSQDGKGNMAATIISYFPNIDLKAAANGHYISRYWESLHGMLNQEAREERPEGGHFVRWLFIRFPSPQLSFAQCREFCRMFASRGKDGLSFNYLEEFLSFGDICASIWRWLKLCINSWKLDKFMAMNAHFADSRLNFWPLIKWDWAESFRGWRCLERSLQNRAFKSYYNLAGRQRWNLFPLENCPWERMFTFHAGKKEAGPVYGAQHSIIRPTDFRYFDDPRTFTDKHFAPLQPERLGGNGCSALEQWRANGVPESRLIQLEALRYLYLAKNKAAEEKSGEDFLRGGKPLEPFAPRGHILVLTSFFADETEAHLDLLHKAMAAGVFEGWQISIKPHPVLSVRPWLNGLPEETRKKIMLLDEPLAILLEGQELVWTSNSTTASLEAALKGLPLMVMAPTNDFDLCPIQNVPNLARTANVEDVRKVVENPQPLTLPHDYLDLNPGLDAWKSLLAPGDSHVGYIEPHC